MSDIGQTTPPLSPKRPDRRRDRSLRALTQAMLALLRETDWDDISVQMICTRADVARSTFYQHFDTKQDLLNALFAEADGDLAVLTRDLPQRPGQLRSVAWLLAHMAEAQGVQRRLQGSPAGLVIQNRFRASVGRLILQELSQLGHRPAPEVAAFLAAGAFAAAEAALASGQPDAQAASRITSLILALCRRENG